MLPVRGHPFHKGRPHKGGGGLANADACVNFACKRPKFTDVGGGG